MVYAYNSPVCSNTEVVFKRFMASLHEVHPLEIPINNFVIDF